MPQKIFFCVKNAHITIQRTGRTKHATQRGVHDASDAHARWPPGGRDEVLSSPADEDELLLAAGPCMLLIDVFCYPAEGISADLRMVVGPEI